MAIFAFLAVFVLGLGYQLQHVLFAPSHENSIESGSSTSGSVSGVGRGLGSDAATTQAGLASLESKLRSEIEDWTAAQEAAKASAAASGNTDPNLVQTVHNLEAALGAASEGQRQAERALAAALANPPAAPAGAAPGGASTSSSSREDQEQLRSQLAEAQAQVEAAQGDANALRGEAEKWRAEAQAFESALGTAKNEVANAEKQLEEAKSANTNAGGGGGAGSGLVPLPPPPYLPPPATGASSSVSVSSDPFALHQQKWYEQPGWGRLVSPFEWKEPLPPLIEAWRKCKVDWHDLIPHHSSLWERFGESKDDKFNFMKLVMKEVSVTDYLTQYHDSGLSANFGKNFGPMRNYSSCNLVDDPCMIHGAIECHANSFCSWDAISSTCHEKPEEEANSGPQECPSGANPTRYQNGRFVPVSDPQHSCKRLVHERVFVEHVSDDSATMFYHWWRYFKDVSGKVAGRKGAMEDKLNHFFMERPPNTQFFHYFGLLSKFCWRRTSAIPDGTCFCEPPQKSNVGESGSHAVLEHMLSELGIAATPPTRVRVGILSRRRKRFILNEKELVAATLALGYDVQLLPMEEMTLFEQTSALRSCTVLVGIHGSGLNNAILLPEGSVLVQLLPYKLNYKGAFQQVAHENKVSYLEWGLQDAKASFFHWEFLGERELHNGKQAVLDRGSPRGGAEVYTFWINQDIIVPVDEYVKLIQQAVTKTGTLNPAILAAHPQQQ